MGLLVDSFNPATLDLLMCRDGVSVGWRGEIYDCDFNQQLMLHPDAPGGGGGAPDVFGIGSFNELIGQDIRTGSHCFGCTAGAGSS